MGFEPTNLEVIYLDCTGSCKSNQFDFIVLTHINNIPLVNMSFHSGSTLFRFRAKHSLFYSLVLFAYGEATNTKFVVLSLTRLGVEPMIYRTLSIIQSVLRLCVFSLTINPYNQPTHPSWRGVQYSGGTRSYFYTRLNPSEI